MSCVELKNGSRVFFCDGCGERFLSPGDRQIVANILLPERTVLASGEFCSQCVSQGGSAL